jgi:butyrate kinase
MYKILTINPGSTSTKFAVFHDEEQVFIHTIRHSSEELKPFTCVADQYEFRKNLILEELKKAGIDLSDFSVIMGRGGLIRPVESGVYLVNEKLIHDLKNPIVGEHASNLGGLIAREIADGIQNCEAYIADPIVIDELQDVARISGLPDFPRRSTFHALNQKAMARKYASERGKKYEEIDIIVAHLGGGISVAAHHHGRVIDTNQALDGFGPFSPERAGTIDAGLIVRACFDGKYTKEELLKKLAGKGGLVAHLGTNEAHIVEQRVEAGDEHAKLVYNAMAYNVAKEVGAMMAVLKGNAEALIITGGIAHGKSFVNYIKEMIGSMIEIVVYPGEDEMSALALNGLRVLKGEPHKVY